eukprot:14940603-Heterocapsa_arctica.AAC.1
MQISGRNVCHVRVEVVRPSRRRPVHDGKEVSLPGALVQRVLAKADVAVDEAGAQVAETVAGVVAAVAVRVVEGPTEGRFVRKRRGRRSTRGRSHHE